MRGRLAELAGQGSLFGDGPAIRRARKRDARQIAPAHFRRKKVR